MTSLNQKGLRPCPFCGEAMMFRAALWPSEGDRDGIIHAAPTDCPMGEFSNDTADESIISAWNHRDLPSDAEAAGLIAEWREKMEGVTPGPWTANQSTSRKYLDSVDFSYQSGAVGSVALVGASELEEQNANSAWIAHCSPDNIEKLLALITAQSARIGELEGALESERATLSAVMRQVEADLAAAHGEICKLQGIDPKTHTWPEWSSPANTLRWFKTIRARALTARSEKG